jgi:hypothetical protein
MPVVRAAIASFSFAFPLTCDKFLAKKKEPWGSPSQIKLDNKN